MKKIISMIILFSVSIFASSIAANDCDGFEIKDTFRTYITSPIRI
ncbi:hypothetical protein [Clostridium sp. 19966]|nr:hypothetical protein [Clostridium sp. 19966]